MRIATMPVFWTVLWALIAIPDSKADGLAIALEPIAAGIDSPVGIAHAGDDSGRLFIVSRSGRILIHDGSQLLPTPFLDIDPMVLSGGERGLLGVAFHPGYATNGLFYVNYTNNSGDTVIARYQVSTQPNIADASSALTILQITQPFANHNGGDLHFGPDGYLYIGTGDGGSGGDPDNRAQNLLDLLGKMLRIDVDGATPYAIPSDNPFAGSPGARGEIWAYGLRNPWRFSFDRLTGDLLIGDVGQNQVEEVNFRPAGSPGGENYGWRLMEGGTCFNPPSNCNDGSLTTPIVEYGHGEGCAVTGGFRYRGARLAGLKGVYVFSDACSGTLWGATRQPGGGWRRTVLLESGLPVSAFGEDEHGELYVADLRGGAIHRIVPSPSCSIDLNQEAYQDGETVVASSLRFVNPASDKVAVEAKVWLGVPAVIPGGPDLPIINLGADGSIEMPPGEDIDLGPAPILGVVPTLPRGDYALGCRLLNPETGALLAEDLAPFDLL